MAIEKPVSKQADRLFYLSGTLSAPQFHGQNMDQKESGPNVSD
jgi:hypothetical protein